MKIINDDSLRAMRAMKRRSVDTIITDPPYGLKFMGKGWDHGVPSSRYWKAALRVAKPGAMLLAFGGTRTYHRLACAIEDAGWEIRDCLMWLYGSGFPKSMDISKAIDKRSRAEREVIGVDPVRAAKLINQQGDYMTKAGWSAGKRSAEITVPSTESAKLWGGWGTALKPAWEPILLAMKPFKGTYADNAMKYGVAGFNINDCRVACNGGSPAAKRRGSAKVYTAAPESEQLGRWPANVILDDEAGELLDGQTGYMKDGMAVNRNKKTGCPSGNKIYGKRNVDTKDVTFGSGGGASRFFYCAKASRKERGEGNNHPTVKPLALMRYLVRLTKMPSGGVVLDPFAGSGTTGLAAKLEGRNCILIEKDAAYCKIIRRRLKKK